MNVVGAFPKPGLTFGRFRGCPTFANSGFHAVSQALESNAGEVPLLMLRSD